MACDTWCGAGDGPPSCLTYRFITYSAENIQNLLKSQISLWFNWQLLWGKSDKGKKIWFKMELWSFFISIKKFSQWWQLEDHGCFSSKWAQLKVPLIENYWHQATCLLLFKMGEDTIVWGHSGCHHWLQSGLIYPFDTWLTDLHFFTNNDAIFSNYLICIFILLETYRLYLKGTKHTDFTFNIFLMTWVISVHCWKYVKKI